MFDQIFDTALNKKTASYTAKSGFVNGVKSKQAAISIEMYIQPVDGVLEYDSLAGRTLFAVVARDQGLIESDGNFEIDGIKYSIVEIEEFNQVDILPAHYQLILEKNV